MFNLESSIAQWRQQMLEAGIQSPERLDELEGHLREEMERLTNSGLNGQRAFETAIQQMGTADALKAEFVKDGGTFSERFNQFLLAWTGTTHPQPATNMNLSNLNLNLEPRWVIYVKASAFLLPAVLLWTFSVILLMPKLRQICSAGAGQAFDLARTPALFKPFTAVIPGMMFLADHYLLVCSVIIVTVTSLEWRFKRWPHYRRATIGIGVFIVNTAVLLSLGVMIVWILMAAPALRPFTN